MLLAMEWPNGEVPEQFVPETPSEERVHVLDIDCWCKPDVQTVPRYTLTHRKDIRIDKTEEP